MSRVFNYIKKVISDPRRVIRTIKLLLSRNTTELNELQAYCSVVLGYDVDLNNPRTFNEKLNWLKLFDRNPIYHKLVDKYEVKQIVANKIGSKFVVPIYGIYDSFDDIDFSVLPNQFVIKSTHYGEPIIVKDKSSVDFFNLKRILATQSTKSGYTINKEWVYKDVPARILIEEFLDDHTANRKLQDYKFWCFNGVPRIMYITVKDRDIYENFYDMDFNVVNINHGFPRRQPEFQKPNTFEIMKELASILSEDIPFVRIDFYSVDGRVYFGEYTFYDWGGIHPFQSYKTDLELGNLISLPIYATKR